MSLAAPLQYYVEMGWRQRNTAKSLSNAMVRIVVPDGGRKQATIGMVILLSLPDSLVTYLLSSTFLTALPLPSERAGKLPRRRRRGYLTGPQGCVGFGTVLSD